MNCFPYFVLILLCTACTWAAGDHEVESDDELNLEKRQSAYTCESECGGKCRKRCEPVKEEETTTPDDCTCPEKQNKICCLPTPENQECESDCEGKCRSRCRFYEQENTDCACKRRGQVCCNERLMCDDFDGTCVPRGCKRGEMVLENVYCRHQNRYCCKPIPEDCEEECGGKCRRRCRLYEVQLDSCKCSRGTNKVCCYEEPLCVNYNGTCRPRGCLDREVPMHYKICTHQNRYCCRPTPACEETIHDITGVCSDECEHPYSETSSRKCESGQKCCLPPPPPPSTCGKSKSEGGCEGQCRYECLPGQQMEPDCDDCVEDMVCCSPPMLPNA